MRRAIKKRSSPPPQPSLRISLVPNRDLLAAVTEWIAASDACEKIENPNDIPELYARYRRAKQNVIIARKECGP